jgi:hypothetical protein
MTLAVDRLTAGPAWHWFGYYDKLAFDPTDRYVLGMEVNFEGRSPRPDDTIKVGMVDTHQGKRWIEIGATKAWCWQQGCMLQWLPGKEATVLWNDRDGDRFVCRLLDLQTERRWTIDTPVYSVSPDGTWAVTPDFARINDMRPGYGYAGLPDRWGAELAPHESGIWHVDLETGATDLIVSCADVARVPWPHGDFAGAKHWFNHLLISPDGSRFEFLQRWSKPGSTSWQTRMLTCKRDGSDLRVVADSGHASHFIWRDPDHILVCCSDTGAPNMCLIDVHSRKLEVVDSQGLSSCDGHFSYLPGRNNEWIVTDGGSAGKSKNRRQPLELYHLPSGRVEQVAAFHLPEAYVGEWRVDLHPRVSRAGTKVVVDSAHEGGRQMYLIDLDGVLS